LNLADYKIDSVETLTLRAGLGKQKFWSSQASFPERNSLLVKITAGGQVGWGEAGQYGPPEPVAAAIKHNLAPRIIGSEIEPGRIYEELYAFSRDFGQRGTYVEAISGIDIALWDLLGKILGVPVCRLLGGAFRAKVKVYATGCYYRHDAQSAATIDVDQSIQAAYDEAKSFKEAGFRGIKIKIGLLSINDDLKRIQAVREAIGPDCALMVDANHAYSVPTAVRLVGEMERLGLDIAWFEEPVVPEDLDGYRTIRSKSMIPISGGECSFTRFGFRDLVGGGAGGPCVDIAQPDIAASGGLSEFMKICAIASAHGVGVIPHIWGSGVGLAAGLHAVATLPPTPFTANPQFLENEPVVEFDRNPNPLRDTLLSNWKFTLTDDGCLQVPLDAPGLGVQVDETQLEKFTSSS